MRHLWIKQLFRWWWQPSSRRAQPRPRVSLHLDQLETRTVPSLLASAVAAPSSEPGLAVNNGGNFALVDTTVDKDNHTVLLWTRPDGTAAVWTVDNTFHQLRALAYGEPGWTALKVAAGGDGLTRLLWVNNTTGGAELWLLNADDTVNSTAVYPFTVNGWTPVDMAVGSGTSNQTRLLWMNHTTNQAAVWTVSNSFAITDPAVFGPLAGWSPHALAVSPADVPWLLWDDGQMAALWQLNTDNTLYQTQMYNTGIQPVFDPALDVTVGSDGNAQLLWDNLDSKNGSSIVISTISRSTLAEDTGHIAGSSLFSTPVALEEGADGMTRLVWSNSNGVQEVWLLNSDYSLNGTTTFGPIR